VRTEAIAFGECRAFDTAVDVLECKPRERQLGAAEFVVDAPGVDQTHDVGAGWDSFVQSTERHRLFLDDGQRSFAGAIGNLWQDHLDHHRQLTFRGMAHREKGHGRAALAQPASQLINDLWMERALEGGSQEPIEARGDLRHA